SVRSQAVSTRRRPVLAFGSMPLVRRRSMGSALEDRGDAEPAGGADRDEAASAAILVDDLRQRRQDASAGRGERMAQRDRAALDVHLAAIDLAELAGEADAILAELVVVPGFQRAQHLARERFVDLVEIEILQLDARA